jgi:hypothetical protein
LAIPYKSCPICGSQNHPNASICINCGTTLGSTDPTKPRSKLAENTKAQYDFRYGETDLYEVDLQPTVRSYFSGAQLRYLSPFWRLVRWRLARSCLITQTFCGRTAQVGSYGRPTIGSRWSHRVPNRNLHGDTTTLKQRPSPQPCSLHSPSQPGDDLIRSHFNADITT